MCAAAKMENQGNSGKVNLMSGLTQVVTKSKAVQGQKCFTRH